jgi:phenylalanine-4-hydroxylase
MRHPQGVPAAHGAQLRGNYAVAAADYSVPQEWDHYGAAEHDVWRTLYMRQCALVQRYAAPEFLDGLDQLQVKPETIPRFSDIDAILQRRTGWRLVAVPGLIPDVQFFAHLAQRRFPVSVWIRERHELDYLAEPDLFHDFFGHVPMLLNPVFARFVQAYGEAGPKASALGAVHMLARLYWYTVEFGLIRSSGGLKIYGAGILSSTGEVLYSLESPVPHRIAFDLERVLCTNYLIDAYQQVYFVLDNLEQLFHAGYEIDFTDLYRRHGKEEGVAPNVLRQSDRLIVSQWLPGLESNQRPTD